MSKEYLLFLYYPCISTVGSLIPPCTSQTPRRKLCSMMKSSLLSLCNHALVYKTEDKKQEDGQHLLSPHRYGGGVCRGWLTVRQKSTSHESVCAWAYRGACESRLKGKRGGEWGRGSCGAKSILHSWGRHLVFPHGARVSEVRLNLKSTQRWCVGAMQINPQSPRFSHPHLFCSCLLLYPSFHLRYICKHWRNLLTLDLKSNQNI